MDKRYKFIIVSNEEGTRKELSDNPIGWDNVKFSVIRDLVYFGVFKSISAEFEFIGDGYRELQRLYLKYGVDADALLLIYDGNKFFFDSKFNFVNFSDDRNFAKIKIDLIQSSFVQNFQNREDVQVNLLQQRTLDLEVMNPLPSYTATLRGKTLLFYSEFLSTVYTSPTLPPDYQTYHHLVPFELTVNDNDNVKQVFAIDTTDAPTASLYQATNGFYTNLSPTAQTFDLSFNFSIGIVFLGDNKVPFGDRVFNNVVRYAIQKIDENGDFLDTLYEQQFEEVTGDFTLSDTQTVTLEAGESLVFVCFRLRSAIGDPYEFLDMGQMDDQFETRIYYFSRSMTITEESIFPDSECFVFLPHEVFNQFIWKLTGYENAVYSDHFGRTDIGYDVDGTDSLLAITTGMYIRGKEVLTSPINTTFRDLFKSYNSVGNLGLLISGNSFIIEPKDDLINYNIAVDLEEVSNVIVSPANDFIHNRVKTGFPNIEYASLNGNDEVNTTAQYTNSIKSVDSELDLVSVYRGDGRGIELLRRLQFVTDGTTDNESDEKIFFVDLVRDGEGGFMSRRLEGITDVSGILSPETAMNLRITPAQTILRWQRYLAISLSRKPLQIYSFQSKDKNDQLTLTTSLGTTTDNQDIELYQPPYFIPEYREFFAPLTPTMLPAILANPLGLIKYTYDSETFYDFLFEVMGEQESAKGNWKVMATKPSPVQVTATDGEVPDAILYDSALDSYILYGNSPDDYILYE